MSYRIDRLVLAVLVSVAAGGTAQAAVDCPATLSGRRLTGMSVFVGDPAKQMDLAPDTPPARTGWVNLWELRASAGLTAVCRYDGGGQQAFALPAGLSSCRVDGSARRTQATCQ